VFEPVDDELSHDVRLIDDGDVEQVGDLEGHREGLAIDAAGWLVVLLDEAGGVVREVGELAVDTALLHRGVVEFAEFALRRVKPAGDPRSESSGSRSVVGESQNSFVAVSSCWWISSPATSPSSSWSYSGVASVLITLYCGRPGLKGWQFVGDR